MRLSIHLSSTRNRHLACSLLRCGNGAFISHCMRLPFSPETSRFCEREMHMFNHNNTATTCKLSCMHAHALKGCMHAHASKGGFMLGLACSSWSVGIFRVCMRGFSSGVKGGKKDLYRLLGVSPKDTPRAIRAAYLRKAKELHPDANAHCPRRHHKEKLFREVTEAYQVLADPEKRKEYDANRTLNYDFSENKERRYSTEDWHLGRDHVGEEFWRQVEQIRKEKEMAWRTMKSQRQSETSSSSGVGSSFQTNSFFALLRALPLLLVPVVLFYALYKSAMARAQNADRPLPPIVRDELGRAFFIDSQGRHFRVMEFDFLSPNSKDRPI